MPHALRPCIFVLTQALLPVGGDDVAAIADALDAARSVGAGVFAATVVRSSAFVDVWEKERSVWAYGVGCPKGYKMAAGHLPCGRASPEMFQRWATHRA
jgi:hypothetical protein